jgi:hypothetical protein
MVCLKELTVQVREDIPEEQGSVHLWTAVEDAEFLLGFIEMSDDPRDLYTEDQLTLALQSVNNADTLLKQTKVGADFSVAFNILTKED